MNPLDASSGVSGNERYKSISCSRLVCLAVTEEGGVVSWGSQNALVLGRSDIAGNGYSPAGWVHGALDGVNIVAVHALSTYPFETSQAAICAALSSQGRLYLWGDLYSSIFTFPDSNVNFVLLTNKGAVGLASTSQNVVYSWSVVSSSFYIARSGNSSYPSPVSFPSTIGKVTSLLGATLYGLVVSLDGATSACMINSWGAGLLKTVLPSGRRPDSYNFTAAIKSKFGGDYPVIMLIDGSDAGVMVVENDLNCYLDPLQCTRKSRLFCMFLALIIVYVRASGR